MDRHTRSTGGSPSFSNRSSQPEKWGQACRMAGMPVLPINVGPSEVSLQPLPMFFNPAFGCVEFPWLMSSGSPASRSAWHTWSRTCGLPKWSAMVAGAQNNHASNSCRARNGMNRGWPMALKNFSCNTPHPGTRRHLTCDGSTAGLDAHKHLVQPGMVPGSA